MNRKPTTYEIQLSQEILKLSKLNGSLIGSLEGILHLNIDSEIKIEIANTIRDAKIYNMNKELNSRNLCHKIVEVCFNYFDVDVRKALAEDRKHNVIQAKHFSMFFMKEELNLTDSEIGRYFNNNHSTVIHAIKRMTGYVEMDKVYQKYYKEIKEDLKIIYT